MISFVPYKPAHLAQLRLQPAQEALRPHLVRPGYAESLAVPGLAWTGVADGVPVGCAGLLPQWEGRVVAWALFGNVPKQAWATIVGKMRREFRALGALRRHRVEFTVPCDFGPGCRLAHILGFAAPGPPMREYGPDGRDHLMYERILACR